MILEITQRDEWTAILQTVEQYDFYHTFDYHRLSCEPIERPVLLVYLEKRTIIAIPLIIRPIPGSELYDATSVYGYPGPVSSLLPKDFDNTAFLKELKVYFNSKKIVSVFSRLNPFIAGQSVILKGTGELNVAGQVVGIDLSLDTEQQRNRYSSRLKTQLNRARKDIRIRKGNGENDILSFFKIYTESMDRVNAEARYYFSENYFHDFFASEQIGAELLLAECTLTDELMAGSIFVSTGDVVQYHLGGTLTAFIERMPSKLLIDEMRIRCDGRSKTDLNLGGGLGGNNDGLFRFKKSFSPSVRLFSVWRYIVNRKAYGNLVKRYAPGPYDTKRPFPEYRF